IKSVLETIGQSYEIVPVNDGSTDRTLEILQEFAKKDPHIRVATYANNIGRGKALRV
ncbi:MAG: glycosyltransferase, partial [candidate division Zixibacteria bacterium]|nr:glycosyltransferase [candidate division Zixibacteria bacterium]